MAAARRRACLAALRASPNPKALANPFRTVLACSAGAWAISSCGGYIWSRVNPRPSFLCTTFVDEPVRSTWGETDSKLVLFTYAKSPCI